MALWLQEGTRVKVQKLDVKENYTQANLSSSRKDQNGGGYKYSDWGFVRFVGKAHEFMSSQVKVGDVIVLNKAQFTKEPYNDKEGNKAYPKNPQLVVFSCELYRAGANKSEDSAVTQPSEDDIPF